MAQRRINTGVLAALALGGGALTLAYVIWVRRNPSACPYSQRLVLELPRLFHTRAHVRDILAPRPGERILEVGPGTGHYSLDIAPVLAPDGVLDILDRQRPMLDLTMQRARERGITTIVPTHGDAQALPYADGQFDAAFLVATLGEVPDRDAALRELRRVLRPGGRLIVGEGLPDPHMVPFDDLRARAEAAGLRYEWRLAGRLGYLARFVAPA